MTLNYFKSKAFISALKTLFDNLEIPVNYISDAAFPLKEVFKENYKSNNPAHGLIKEVYVLGKVDDEAFGEEMVNRKTILTSYTAPYNNNYYYFNTNYIEPFTIPLINEDLNQHLKHIVNKILPSKKAGEKPPP